jgi:ubiquinone/menaquinone biosynthesis C-methylase UbiE
MEPNTQWQISGNSAERYEQHLVPTIFIPWAERLLERAELHTDEDVLDIACGTGIVSRRAKPLVGDGGRVVGVDLNQQMLDVAAKRALAEGCDIEWLQADASSIPLADDSFDVAFCQQGFQFFPDKPAALTELRRLLRKGGRCIFCVAQGPDLNPMFRAQEAAVTKHMGPEAARAFEVVRSLADTDTLRGLFDGAGFADVHIESVSVPLVHDDGVTYVTELLLASPVADRFANWSDEARAAFIDDYLTEFGDCFDGKGLRFPHVGNVVIARND